MIAAEAFELIVEGFGADAEAFGGAAFVADGERRLRFAAAQVSVPWRYERKVATLRVRQRSSSCANSLLLLKT